MRNIFVLTLLLSMTTAPLLGVDDEREEDTLFSYIHYSVGGGMHDKDMPAFIAQYEKNLVRDVFRFCCDFGKYVYKKVDESVGSGKFDDFDDLDDKDQKEKDA